MLQHFNYFWTISQKIDIIKHDKWVDVSYNIPLMSAIRKIVFFELYWYNILKQNPFVVIDMFAQNVLFSIILSAICLQRKAKLEEIIGSVHVMIIAKDRVHLSRSCSIVIYFILYCSNHSRIHCCLLKVISW
jgi:hypothetical protein